MFNPVHLSTNGQTPGWSQPAADRAPFNNSGSLRSESVRREAMASAASHIESRERFLNAESFTLSLKTRDGDSVLIEFSSEENYRSQFSAANTQGQGSSSVMRYSIDRQSSSEFGFSVQGDLDLEEINAIATLVQDLSLLADEFFNGDLQSSMNLLSHINFDSSQLSAMDFSMQQTQSYSAISTYQQVQSLGQPAGSENKALRAYGQQLLEQFNKAEVQLEQAREMTMSLMINLVQIDTRFSQNLAVEQSSMLENIEALEQLVTQSGYEQPLSGEQNSEY